MGCAQSSSTKKSKKASTAAAAKAAKKEKRNATETESEARKSGVVFRVKLLQALHLRSMVNRKAAVASDTSANSVDDGSGEGGGDATKREYPKCDPYVVLSSTGTEQVFSSSLVLQNSENPSWNEEFFFILNDGTGGSEAAPFLALDVYDRSLLSDDKLMGSAKIPLDGLITKFEEKECWVPIFLTDEESSASGEVVVTGEIGFTVVECYRLYVQPEYVKNIEPLTSKLAREGMYIKIKAGQQEAIQTTPQKVADPTWGADTSPCGIFFVPYAIPTQLDVFVYSHMSVGLDICRGFHHLHLCGKPGYTIPAANASSDGSLTLLELPLKPGTGNDEEKKSASTTSAPTTMFAGVRFKEDLQGSLVGGWEGVNGPLKPDRVNNRRIFRQQMPMRPQTKKFSVGIYGAQGLMVDRQLNADPSTLQKVVTGVRDRIFGSLGFYARVTYGSDQGYETQRIFKDGSLEPWVIWQETFHFNLKPALLPFQLPHSRNKHAPPPPPPPPQLMVHVLDQQEGRTIPASNPFNATRLVEQVVPGFPLAQPVKNEIPNQAADLEINLHHNIVIRVLSATIFEEKDPNGLADPFFTFRIAGNEARTRIIKETRSPVFNDVIRIALPAAINPLELRLKVELYDADFALTNTHTFMSDLIGIGDVDIAALPARTPTKFSLNMDVAGVTHGVATIEVTNNCMPPRDVLVIQEARFGYRFSATDEEQEFGLWAGHVATEDASLRHPPGTPGAAGQEHLQPPTWCTVTQIIRSMVINNELVIDCTDKEPDYLPNMFWPQAPDPNQVFAGSSYAAPRQHLAIKYTVGDSPILSATLAVNPDGSPEEPKCIHLISEEKYRAMMKAAEEAREAAASEAQLKAEHEAAIAAMDAAKAETQRQLALLDANKSGKAEEIAEMERKLKALREAEEAEKKRVEDTQRRAQAAQAAAVASAGREAMAAREKLNTMMDEVDSVKLMLERYETEADAAKAAADAERKKREDEAHHTSELNEQQRAEAERLQQQLADLQQRTDAASRQKHDEMLREQERMRQEHEEARRKQQQAQFALQEQERQAKLLMDRIARLQAQEEESKQRAEQAKREAEEREQEALDRAAKAQAAAALRSSPSYWSVGDDAKGLTKVEITKEPIWQQRFQELLDNTCRRKTLGCGRDQIIKSGKYDRLLFHRAWRLENPKLYSLYAAHRDTQVGVPPEECHAQTHALPTSDWITDELGLRTKERNELLLWHGTKPDAVDIIATEGFDERVCRLSGLFGAGVYLADEVSKSDQYTTPTPETDPINGVYHIFLVRATMGRFKSLTKGAKEARRAPAGCQSIVGQIDKNKYREYVVYDGWLVYPEFLIEYKRNYK